MQAVGRHQALAPGRGQLDQGGARGRHGDLLADHGPDQQFLRIHGAGHPHARRARHAGRQPGIGREGAVDGDGVGVEVQQPADPAQQRGQVPQVHGADGQHQRAAGRAGVVLHPEAGVAVGQPQGPGIGSGGPFLDPGDGADGEEVEHAGIERFPVRQVEGERRGGAVGRRGGAAPWPAARRASWRRPRRWSR